MNENISREEMDRQVEEALYRRACGYEAEDTDRGKRTGYQGTIKPLSRPGGCACDDLLAPEPQTG